MVIKSDKSIWGQSGRAAAREELDLRAAMRGSVMKINVFMLIPDSWTHWLSSLRSSHSAAGWRDTEREREMTMQHPANGANVVDVIGPVKASTAFSTTRYKNDLLIHNDVFACTACASMVHVCVCIYQAHKLGEGHAHSNHHLLLPVTSWSDFHVVVLKQLLMEPSLCFWGSCKEMVMRWKKRG